jgi:hypothetical protein
MNYTLLFYQSPTEFAARTDPAKRDKFWASFMPYMKALQDAGIIVAGAGLEPPETGTTMRLGADGQRYVQDGPYADTKEQLGGLFIINVPDLDTALEWAIAIRRTSVEWSKSGPICHPCQLNPNRPLP